MRKIATLVTGFLLTATTLMAAGFISKAAAEKDALVAVGGGKVMQAVLETGDGPAQWLVDVLQTKYEFEVHLNANTGKVMQIIKQTP